MLGKYLKTVLLILRAEILHEITFTDIFHVPQVNLENNHIYIILSKFRGIFVEGYNILYLLGYVEFFLPLNEYLIAYLFQVKVVVERVSIQSSAQAINLLYH